MAERNLCDKNKKKWLILAWSVYLIALPAWVIIFISKDNWIAAAVESGAVPSMFVGLWIAWQGHGKQPLWLDQLSILAVAIGLGLSFYNFSGITSINQILELGIAAGFLIGTYQLAKKNSQGYLWFIVGNISCALLMDKEGFLLLMAQQVISLGFVIDAYLANKRLLAI